MRLFIGIELPSDLKQHINNYLLPIHLSPKGWEHPHDYHQTLLFIGEATEEECLIIKKRMIELSFPTFKLTTSGFKFFNRRIMYLAFEDSPELLKLKKIIEEAFPEWVREGSREFIPHVTVKRWQRYEFNHLEQNLMERKFIDETFEVNKISLYLSQKDEENRKYHIIYSTDLNSFQ